MKVTVDAYPGKRFDGSVVRISPRGVNVSNVVTFEVKVEVTAPEKALLRPEMTANVEVLVAEKTDVLLAPSDAIVRKGGKATVTVRKADGATEAREVAHRHQRRQAHGDPLRARGRRDRGRHQRRRQQVAGQQGQRPAARHADPALSRGSACRSSRPRGSSSATSSAGRCSSPWTAST